MTMMGGPAYGVTVGKATTVLDKNSDEEPVQGAADPVDGAATQKGGARFERRRSDILAAAIPILNSLGFKGMRLTAVAQAIGLRSTSVTYYFPRKEELAVACMEAALAVFHDLLAIAEQEPDARSRIARLISLYVERDAAVRQGRAVPLASFASLRSLDGAHFDRMFEGYRVMFRRVRGLLKCPELGRLDTHGRSIRSLILLEQLYWTHGWLADLDLDEYPRATARLTDVVLNGLAMRAEDYNPDPDLVLSTSAPGVDPAKEAFLRAATRQINLHGYSGASVDRISAALNVTKGAFYHHNDAKDDVVAACFRRSFAIMALSRKLVRRKDGPEWRRLTTGILSLVRFQVSEEGPLLATGVLYSMPEDQKVGILEGYAKTERAIAAMISDAISEGHVRTVDATIAAHLLVAALNSAATMRLWPDTDPREAPEGYCKALFLGLMTP